MCSQATSHNPRERTTFSRASRPWDAGSPLWAESSNGQLSFWKVPSQRGRLQAVSADIGRGEPGTLSAKAVSERSPGGQECPSRSWQEGHCCLLEGTV